MALTIDYILAKTALLNTVFDRAIVAKLDCQPYNTKKQYKGYQRQQDIRTNINYLSQGPLANIVQEFCKKHNFPDSIIVTEKKVCLWLQEDVLLQQVLLKTTKVKSNKILGKYKRGTDSKVLASDNPAEISIQLLVEIQLLSNNSIFDTDTNILLSTPNSTLLKAGTVESYIAAVAELYSIQVTSSYNKESFF